MSRWKEGLVDAFPVPDDRKFSRLTLKGTKLEHGSDPTVAKEDDAVSIPYNPDPFPFFALPAELRNRVYNLVLFSKPGYRGADGHRKGMRIAVLLASKAFHQEASYALYTTHRFLIFPLQLFTSLPTIQDLPRHYRVLVTNLEMAVGESFTAPPKTWRMSKKLARCLGTVKNVQTLRIFVKFDPSHPDFRRYKIDFESYTRFCGGLLKDVLEAMPRLQYVQLDGHPGVDVHGALVSRLRNEALEQNKTLRWGREANWAHQAADDVGSLLSTMVPSNVMDAKATIQDVDVRIPAWIQQ